MGGRIRYALPVLCVTLAALAAGAAEPGEGSAGGDAGGGQTAGRDGGRAWEGLRRAVLGFGGLDGSIEVKELSYWSFPPVKDITGVVRISDKGWRFENIRGDFCGGLMRTEAAIDFIPPTAEEVARKGEEARARREFALASTFTGARLEELCRSVEYPVTPGELDGGITLKVTSEGLAGLSGRASFSLRSSKLAELPLVVKVLSFLTLSPIDNDPIEVAEARSIILTPQGMIFEDLTLRTRSGGFRVEAEPLGRISYDGSMQMNLRPFLKLKLGGAEALPGIDVAGEILDKIKQRAARLRVSGNIREPRFQWAPIR
jgi:hypothetical protein